MIDLIQQWIEDNIQQQNIKMDLAKAEQSIDGYNRGLGGLETLCQLQEFINKRITEQYAQLSLD